MNNPCRTITSPKVPQLIFSLCLRGIFTLFAPKILVDPRDGCRFYREHAIPIAYRTIDILVDKIIELFRRFTSTLLYLVVFRKLAPIFILALNRFQVDGRGKRGQVSFACSSGLLRKCHDHHSPMKPWGFTIPLIAGTFVRRSLKRKCPLPYWSARACLSTAIQKLSYSK